MVDERFFGRKRAQHAAFVRSGHPWPRLLHGPVQPRPESAVNMARPTLRQPITTRRVIVMRDGSTGAPEEGSSLPGIRELELRTLSLKIGQMEHDVADARKRAEVAQQQWETSVGASKEVFGSTLIRHNAEVTDGLQVLGQLRQREQQLRSGQQYQVKDVRDDQQFPDSRAQVRHREEDRLWVSEG